jgi:hypothetical protein
MTISPRTGPLPENPDCVRGAARHEHEAARGKRKLAITEQERGLPICHEERLVGVRVHMERWPFHQEGTDLPPAGVDILGRGFL